MHRKIGISNVPMPRVGMGRKVWPKPNPTRPIATKKFWTQTQPDPIFIFVKNFTDNLLMEKIDFLRMFGVYCQIKLSQNSYFEKVSRVEKFSDFTSWTQTQPDPFVDFAKPAQTQPTKIFLGPNPTQTRMGRVGFGLPMGLAPMPTLGIRTS